MASAPARDARGRLLPGQALNPGGRRKLPEDVRVAIYETGHAAVARLHEIITDPAAFGRKGWLAARDQLKAIELACDRAFGRPDLAPQDNTANAPEPFDVSTVLASAVAEMEAMRGMREQRHVTFGSTVAVPEAAPSVPCLPLPRPPGKG